MDEKTDCWSILKINTTDDIREIKKAYAQQLRIYNPEDDQLGFMRLRESYEQALNWASVSKYDNDDTMVAQLDEQLAELLQYNTDENKFDYSDTLSVKLKEQLVELLSDNTGEVALIFEKLTELYNCFERRTNSDEWQWFFDSLNVSEFQVLQNIVVWFLNEHYVLPRYIWYYLDSELNFAGNPFFSWAFLMEEPHDTCTPLLTTFGDYFKAAGIDLAQYAELRTNAYIAYIESDWGPAEDFARRAICIYNKDYLMHAILAEALAFTDRKQEAVDHYQQSLTLQSDYRMHYSLARTWLELGEYKKASKEFYNLRSIFSAKGRREQKLVKDKFLEYEEMFLNDRLRVGEISKIGYSFRKNTLQQAKQISFVYRSPQNSWWMTFKGYIPIILSVGIIMTIRTLLHC